MSPPLQSGKPEVWLRGPVEDITPVLQPVAHALLQASEEIHSLMMHFPEEKLWTMPSGAASVGFHLQHITGVLDRLFTYAEGKRLSQHQLHYLSREGIPDDNIPVFSLLESFDAQVLSFIDALKNIDPDSLTNYRAIGRKGLPSTILGLLFHSAEHTMRHTGQLLVTVKVLTNS